MNLPFKKKEETPLKPEIAEQILGNVFDTVGQEHNSVPLEALTSYANYRKERYTLQRTTILIVLVLFMLLPLLFITAKIIIAVNNEQENPVYAVKVDSTIPVGQIIAKINGKNVPIYEVAPNEYIVQPGTNGELSVSVTLINRQITSAEVTVDNVDTETPYLVSTDSLPTGIALYLHDADSALDADNITVVDENGEPVAFDYFADKEMMFLAYPDSTLEISVPDMRGNTLRIRLKTN